MSYEIAETWTDSDIRSLLSIECITQLPCGPAVSGTAELAGVGDRVLELRLSTEADHRPASTRLDLESLSWHLLSIVAATVQAQHVSNEAVSGSA